MTDESTAILRPSPIRHSAVTAQTAILGAAGTVAIVAGYGLFRANNREAWRATVTPLASIIGSGFLVAAPILVGTFGGNAVFAMAALLAVAFALGHVMRFNIRHGETRFAARQDRFLFLFEGASDAALSFAYFVSVAYYLSLLGTFVLHGIGIESEAAAKALATGVLLFIGILGFRGGIAAVSRVESAAVGLKLAIIAAICAALAVALFVDPGDAAWPRALPLDWHAVAILLGTLIVCQGFETSRYLGDEFAADMRIRTMRLAQMISAAIYIVFFVLITPFLSADGDRAGVTALMDIVSTLSIVLLIALTIAAAASQFTAAMADATASTGLLREVSRNRIAVRNAYLALVPVAVAIIWLTDVTSLISYASRAFAIYYALQCIVAVRVAVMADEAVSHRRWRIAGYAALAALSALIVIFGLPAEE